jgi:hypothetical protein
MFGRTNAIGVASETAEPEAVSPPDRARRGGHPATGPRLPENRRVS